MGDIMESMGINEVFNVSLHVRALGMDELVLVLRNLQCFTPFDILPAADLLITIHAKMVPIKKLLLWVEMARQNLEEGQKLPLARWEQTLLDLA